VEGGRGLEKGVPARLTPVEGRRFAFPVGAAFILLAGLVLWRGHTPAAWVFGTLGAALLLAGLTVPGRLGPVYRSWMRFALLLSKVTTPVFMGIVFFLVIAPIGLVMRLLGRNPLVREPGNGSYFVPRPDGPGRRSDLERQF
jgi:hypothetical protein